MFRNGTKVVTSISSIHVPSSRSIVRAFQTGNASVNAKHVRQRAIPRATPRLGKLDKVPSRHAEDVAQVLPLIEESLPPYNLLDMGHKSGAVELKPEEALGLLRKYHQAFLLKGHNWESRFCNENNIKPETLTLLGSILNKCANRPQKILGKHIMLSASALGDEAATLQLLRSAFRTDRLHNLEYDSPLQQLNKLSQNGSVPSMVLLGQIKQNQGKEKEALELFNKAAAGVPESDKEVSSGYVDALLYQGALLLKQGKATEGYALLQKAALEHDNPLAYHLFAGAPFHNESTREIYLLKAASSGVVDACYDLGMWYLERAKNGQGEKDMAMGREWLHVAADAGHEQSSSILAQRADQ